MYRFLLRRTRNHCDAEELTLEQAIAIALRDNRQVKNAQLAISKAGDELAAALPNRPMTIFYSTIVYSWMLSPMMFFTMAIGGF